MGQKAIPWQAPATMITGLMAACALAIGHHFFYASLDGTHVAPPPVEGARRSLVSQQQLNTGGGTALAFLVKMFLVLSVSTAYTQVFWQNAAMDGRKPTLSTLDTIYEAWRNPIRVLKVKLWLDCPMLLALGMAAWLLPVASIVTPATLSTMLGHHNYTAPTKVPNVAYQSLSLLADMPPELGEDGLAAFYPYSGPSPAVQRIVAATAAEAAILPIAAPSPNSTWVNHFLGPGLFCESVNASTQHAFEVNIAEHIWNVRDGCNNPSGYIAWAPAETYRFRNSSILPYVKQQDGNYTLNDVPWMGPSGNNVQTLYVVSAPELLEVTLDPSDPQYPITKACELIGWYVDDPGQGASWRNATFAQRLPALFSGTATMLQCHLYNTSYTANFTYVSGAQEVGVSTHPLGDPLGLEIGTFGSIMDVTNCTLTSSDPNCLMVPYSLETLSYQAVFDAFRSLLAGTVSMSQDLTLYFDTKILMTALPEVAELSFLTNASSLLNTTLVVPSLQTAVETWPGSLLHGLSNSQGTHSTLSLPLALEALFRNVTISLMSETQLQANDTSTYASALTDVTFFESNIQVYSYDSVKLWAAYGCAIGVSAVAVLLGFWVIFSSGAAYSDNFSTLVRVTRDAEMSVDIALVDRDGKDPLPDYLAESTLAFPASRSKWRVGATYFAVARADGQTSNA
ncbi:hypothetical protein LTR56_000234 [Elasticomyces elasticus]|nr:hypothetical protein LTR56_000234 [Elasticomyces elasticus]KAK3667220.1 hypothetical protein LTR22_002087 [Elasticomyces elasticus]KAK5768600.1 hypothetical protein LTS12_001023 [Elasticomyces elasticus]